MLTRIFRQRLAGAAALLIAALLAASPSPAKEVMLRAWPAKLAVPPLRLADTSGREWDLRSLRGKVVLLNFWASWCEPCAEELPVLQELAARAPGELVVLGVDYKEPAETVRSFAAQRHAAYPMLLDSSGEQFKKWTGGVLPTTVLIDRKGRARWRVIGELDPADAGFEQALRTLLRAGGQ
jgi:thiol-disulfide isomerase/thioredoxin